MEQISNFIIIDNNTTIKYQNDSIYNILTNEINEIKGENVEQIILTLINNGYVIEFDKGTLLFHSNQLLCNDKTYSELFMESMKTNFINHKGKTMRNFFALNVGATTQIYDHIIKGVHVYVLTKKIRLVIYPLLNKNNKYIPLKYISKHIFDIDNINIPKILSKHNFDGILSIDTVDEIKFIPSTEIKNTCCQILNNYYCHDIVLINENNLFNNIVKLNQTDIFDPAKIDDDIIKYNNGVNNNLDLYFDNFDNVKKDIYHIYIDILRFLTDIRNKKDYIKKDILDSINTINNFFKGIPYKDRFNYHYCFNLKIIEEYPNISGEYSSISDEIKNIINNIKKLYKYGNNKFMVILILFFNNIIPNYLKKNLILLEDFLLSVDEKSYDNILSNLEKFKKNEINELTISILLYGQYYTIEQYYLEILKKPPNLFVNHFESSEYYNKEYHRNNYIKLLLSSAFNAEELYNIIFNSLVLKLPDNENIYNISSDKNICENETKYTYRKINETTIEKFYMQHSSFSHYFSIVDYFRFTNMEHIYKKNQIDKLIELIEKGNCELIEMKSFIGLFKNIGEYSYFINKLKIKLLNKNNLLMGGDTNIGPEKIDTPISLNPYLNQITKNQITKINNTPMELTAENFTEKIITNFNYVRDNEIIQKITQNKIIPNFTQNEFTNNDKTNIENIIKNFNELKISHRHFIFTNRFKNLYNTYLHLIQIRDIYSLFEPLIYTILNDNDNLDKYISYFIKIFNEFSVGELDTNILFFQQVFPYLTNLSDKIYKLIIIVNKYNDKSTFTEDINDKSTFTEDIIDLFDLFETKSVNKVTFISIIENAIDNFEKLVINYFSGDNYLLRVFTFLIEDDKYDFDTCKKKLEIQLKLLGNEKYQ